MERKRVALVTGGAKGIGKAIALKLADAGFSLAINYRTSEKKANELVSYLQSRGVNALAIRADVSKRRSKENARNLQGVLWIRGYRDK